MPCQLKSAHFQDFIEGMTAKLLSRFFDILCVNESKVDCDVSCICNIDNPKMHMTATDAVLPRNLIARILPKTTLFLNMAENTTPY